ncbi:hypothetical protein C0991_001006, partial [Blastosporella zonata]
MRADMSSKPIAEIPQLTVPLKLETVKLESNWSSANFQTVQDYFTESGPNGSHLCLVIQLAGPSVLAMSDSPGRIAGSKRLRSDLARKVAKQVVGTVHMMHSAGFVHGGLWLNSCSKEESILILRFADLTTANILFHIKDSFHKIPDSTVYAHFGEPETEAIVT